MTPIDTIRDSFKIFLANGDSPLEAFQRFDREEFYRAAMEELSIRGHAAWMDADSLASLGLLAQQEEWNAKDMDQAIPLWAAGWTSQAPNLGQIERVMAWYWRAPVKGNRKLGRRYMSTNQAFMAMQREAK